MKPVADGVGKKVIGFFAGGYDTCNDPNMDCGSADQKGNAVYAVDVKTGLKLWEFSKANDSRMTFSISSDIAALDINGDTKVDRLYVGDTGGQLWRFDIGNLNNTAGWTGKVIFKSNQSASEKRKMFYPPDVSLESGYEWVYIGTGDRENPKQETGTGAFPTQNRLYAIKDTNPSSPLTESNLVDVTSDILQKPNPTPDDINNQNLTLINLRNLNGWFITLENKGEKCLASPVIYSGTVYYTTFTPSYPNEGDICFLGEGTGRVYVVQYKTGMAMFNFDLTNDIEGQPPTIYKTDRSVAIGAGIPSQVVIAIVKGEVVGYIGVGGGVFAPEVANKKNILPLYWRTVF
jgi:type IV pilus assembly protein PilY1